MYGFILDNNLASKSLGLRITKVPSIPTTKRVIDSIDVDGREGSLTLFKGWEDLKFSFYLTSY